MIAAARLALGLLTIRQRVQYVSFVVLRALTGFLDVLGIFLIGFIASVGATQFGEDGASGKPSTILGIEIPPLDEGQLLLIVVGVLVVFVGKALLAIGLTRLMTQFIARIETENATKISEMLLRGSLDDVKRYSKAQLQYAVTSSASSLFTGILNNVATLVSEGFLLVVIVASFFIVNPLAAVFTLLYFAIIVVVIQVVIGGSIRRAGKESAIGSVDTINALSDSLDSFREISVLGKQRLFLEKLEVSRGRLSRSAAMFAFLGGMPRYVVETALILGVVIFVGQQFLAGELASGIVTIGVFLTGGVRIMASLLPLQAAVSAITQNAQQAAIAVELLRLATSPAVRESMQKTGDISLVPRDAPLAVHIDAVRFRYPGDTADTLHDIKVDFAPGQYVAIIGPSGAGKTTLVDLILGLIRPDTGTVEIGGMSPVVLRALAPGLVSYVPQKPGMVSGTIAENIALGVRPSEIDHELLERAISAAYLTDFIASLPDGVDTSVGAQVDALSGGQIQRIGLARALYAQPRFLILDEATSGLDAGSEAFVAQSLRHLHGDVTVVVIAHRLSTVQHADVVHVMQEGRIAASGDFKTLRKTVPMVAEYVKLMSFEGSEPTA